MFLLDLFYLAAQSVALAAGINMNAMDTYFYPTEMEAVVAVQGERDWMRSDGKGKCFFDGAMVPYSQDWTEIKTNDEGHEVVTEPTPDKRKGHAMIFYKKTCGTKVEPVLYLGDNVLFILDAAYSKGHNVLVDEYNVAKPADLPNWAPQVMARLERLQANDFTAASALAALTQYQNTETASVFTVEQWNSPLAALSIRQIDGNVVSRKADTLSTINNYFRPLKSKRFAIN